MDYALGIDLGGSSIKTVAVCPDGRTLTKQNISFDPEAGMQVTGREPSQLSVEVSDDGRGFPQKIPEPPGLGLRLMTHGASLIGGKLAITRKQDGGTLVTCNLNAVQSAD